MTAPSHSCPYPLPQTPAVARMPQTSGPGAQATAAGLESYPWASDPSGWGCRAAEVGFVTVVARAAG